MNENVDWDKVNADKQRAILKAQCLNISAKMLRNRLKPEEARTEQMEAEEIAEIVGFAKNLFDELNKQKFQEW